MLNYKSIILYTSLAVLSLPAAALDRFTKIDANGTAMPADATGHQCVYDDTTDLLWEVKTDDGGLRDKDWRYSWYFNGVGYADYADNCYDSSRCDTEKFAADVNAAGGLCGVTTGWVVPSKDQLVSIVDTTVSNPSINTNYFPNTVNDWFWTATPYPNDSCCSWVVHFYSGYVNYNHRNSDYFVRGVRVGQWLLASFALNINKLGAGLGTITSSPAGINCGGSTGSPNVCSAQFSGLNSTVKVALTATPAAGSTFAGWSSNCANGQVNMTANTTCSATFKLIAKPTAVTNAPSVITNTSARLSGTVNPNGAATDASFDFGLTTAYGTNITATPASIAATAGATTVSADVTNLTACIYHYRVQATNSIGTSYGADKTFTTTVCTQLNNGVALSNQTVAALNWKYYAIEVPSGADNLVFTTTGNSGDVDIYTQFAAMPTENDYLCLSDLEGSNETCTHPSPTAGIWWLGVLGYTGGDYTVTASFRQPQTIGTITFDPTSLFVGDTATASATATSGLTVTFTTTTSDICSINGTTITALTAGTCTIAANQAGDTAYVPADQQTASIEISKKTQTIGSISFNPASLTYGDSGTTASATATSGLTVTFASTTPAICNATGTNGATITINTAGTCTIAADQAGDTAYLPATQVTNNITINQASQTITLTCNPTSIEATKTTTCSATATSNLTVNLATTTPDLCSLNNGTVTGIIPGTCKITADHSGDTNYLAATPATADITITKANQTITLTCNPVTIAVNATATCNAIATSGLTPSMSTAITPSVCSISSGTVTGLTTGTCTVSSKQIGNNVYNPAPQVTTNIAVGTSKYTVTATAGTGGRVTPESNTVTSGATTTFTVTPNTGYTRNPTVGGTCPQGSWNGNLWTTGAIIANCTVTFDFTIKTYTVNPTAGIGGSFTPTGIQTVNHGTTKSYTVTANTGYSTNTAVTGTCPQGTWTGNVWTTGAIIANCTVNFSFIAKQVNTWLNPPNPTVIRNQPFTLDVIVNSNSLKLGSYSFNVTWNATKLVLDPSQQCPQGVCPGANAVDNRVNIVNNAGSITLTGSDNTSVGPGNDLQLLQLHFKTQLTTGATPVNLTTTTLKTPEGGNIGTAARGATVNVTYGLCGDSDGNMRVNIIDALAIARKLVNLPAPPTVDVTLADTNKNSRLDINDALFIARYAVGLVLPPEACNVGKPL